VAEHIFIVRHGETEWSLNGRHTGSTDLPLTEHGREQAAGLGRELDGQPFELVLSSPLERARDTCELAGFGAAAELCDDLREWDYGDFEGMTTPEIHSAHPTWNLWRDGCPGGESPAQIAARVERVLARISGAHGDAIAFAHGHVLRVLTARWLRMEVSAGARFKLAAAAVGVLGYERDTEVIERWSA
jgi:broad specificity phosphatase PhoE